MTPIKQQKYLSLLYFLLFPNIHCVDYAICCACTSWLKIVPTCLKDCRHADKCMKTELEAAFDCYLPFVKRFGDCVSSAFQSISSPSVGQVVWISELLCSSATYITVSVKSPSLLLYFQINWYSNVSARLFVCFKSRGLFSSFYSLHHHHKCFSFLFQSFSFRSSVFYVI